MIDRDPLEQDPLATRLRSLTFPESATLAPRVIRLHRQGRRVGPPARSSPGWRLGAVALALLAALVTFVTALADVPRAGQVATPLLRMAGLEPLAGRISPQQDSATSAGHTISLVGAYADNTRTMVFLHLDANLMPVLVAGPEALTDQAGRPATTRSQGGLAQYGQDQGADTVLSFGPLAHPEPAGNHLVLHIKTMAMVSRPGQRDVITGDWTLRFSVKADAGAALPTPAPGKLGNVDVSLTMSAVQNRVHYVVTVSGPVADLHDLARAAMQGQLRVRLVDRAGRTVADSGPSGGVSYRRGSDRGDGFYQGDLQAPGPGSYRIVIEWRHTSFDRPVTL
jgi:hypothetical protein